MIQRYLTDCRKYTRGLPDNFFQAIFADPPYDNPDAVEMGELRRVCNGPIIMFCAPRYPFFESTHLAYWFKQPAPKIVSKQIQSSNVEWILIDCKPGMYYNPNLFWANYIEVFTDVLITKPVHPFEKPVSLWERLMTMYANPNDVRPIFDPFMGSGSSLRAAQRLRLNVHGCEIDPEWFLLSSDLKGIQ